MKGPPELKFRNKPAHVTTGNDYDRPWLNTRNCLSTVSNQKLSPRALSMLNKQYSSIEQRLSSNPFNMAPETNLPATTGTRNRMATMANTADKTRTTGGGGLQNFVNGDLDAADMINPLENGDTAVSAAQAQRQAVTHRQSKRRATSTFETYYIGTKQAHDLASLASVDMDRPQPFNRGGRQTAAIDHDMEVLSIGHVESILNENDRATKRDNDLFTYKSELKSLIGNLQHQTQD